MNFHQAIVLSGFHLHMHPFHIENGHQHLKHAKNFLGFASSRLIGNLSQLMWLTLVISATNLHLTFYILFYLMNFISFLIVSFSFEKILILNIFKYYQTHYLLKFYQLSSFIYSHSIINKLLLSYYCNPKRLFLFVADDYLLLSFSIIFFFSC